MRVKPIISDASCFIALANIGELDILQLVYGQIVTTPEIAKEFGEDLPDWVEIISVSNKERQEIFEEKIDKGEASAIALALESENPLLVLDDSRARKFAKKLRLDHIGTIGVILAAKQKGVIPAIKPLLEKIKQTNFRLTPELEFQMLTQARE